MPGLTRTRSAATPDAPETTAPAASRLRSDRSRELPRVDLLPAAYAVHARARRQRGILAGVVAFALVTVGAVGAQQRHAAGGAERELVQAQRVQRTVLRSQAKLAVVPKVYAVVDQARADQRLAMGDDVRWSEVLSELAADVPKNVWLTNVTIAQSSLAALSGTAPASSTSSSASTGAAGLSPGSIAVITVTGNALTQSAVADWLDSLALGAGFSQPTFVSAVKAGTGTGDPVQFSSSVQVTDEVLSHRFDSAGN